MSEYVSWPGTGVRPGTESGYPGWGRIAPGSTRVHSPKGSVWKEVTGDDALTSAAALGAAAANAAKELAGPVSLDKITDNGTLPESTARAMAAIVGRFLKIETSQLVASKAAMDEAIIQQIWTRIITAQEGVFDKIRANIVEAGIVDGQIITGATIQTNKPAARKGRVYMNSDGLYMDDEYGTNNVTIAKDGNIRIRGNLGFENNWSFTRFTALDSRLVGSYAIPGGSQYSCGVLVNRRSNPWYGPGALFVFQEPNGTGNMCLSAPYNQGDHHARLTLSRTKVELYCNTGKLFIAPSRIDFSNDYIYMYGHQNRIALGNQGTFPALDLERAGFRLNALNGNAVKIISNETRLTIEYNAKKQVWVDDQGFRAFGGKTFVMDVPEITARTGKVLSHACTESPWDGIEYWERITLDSEGRGTWTLPEYVPLIASKQAPRAVVATADRGTVSAALDDGDRTWTVRVQGEPGAVVGLLVKAGRVVDSEGDGPGRTTAWEDAAPDRLWQDAAKFRPDPGPEQRGGPDAP